jgi:hypothetical protein
MNLSCNISLTIQKIYAKIYAAKREFITGGESKRNEPRGSGWAREFSW